MAEGKDDIVERFSKAGDEARVKAARLSSLVGRPNTPITGAYREAFIRQVIREHLPDGLEAGSGFVRSPTGELSKQMDVIVYETGSDALPFSDGGFVVAETEGVRAVVEVKSRIARGSFLQALGELTRLKSWVPLKPDAPPIYAAIVAFKAPSPGALMRAAQGFYAGRLAGRAGRSRPDAYFHHKYRVVDLVAALGGWCLMSACLPWPTGPAGASEENGFGVPALASLDTCSDGDGGGGGGADVSLHLLVSGLLTHLHDFAGRRAPRAFLESFRPPGLKLLDPAVALLGDLSGVEPGFLARRERVMRSQGFSLDAERGLIVRA